MEVCIGLCHHHPIIVLQEQKTFSEDVRMSKPKNYVRYMHIQFSIIFYIIISSLVK